MGDKLTGDITAAGLTIAAEFLELPTLNPAVLLGMDVLSKLGLQMLLNGTDITPGRNKNKRDTFAISGPIPMTDLEKEKQTQAERFLEKHLGRFNKVRGTTPLIEHQIVLEDPTPVKQRYRPRNPAMQAIIDEEIDEMLEELMLELRGAKYLSTIDLKNGYWHVLLAENSKPLTAFTVYGRGLFEFNVMPFGLHSAPSTFQRLLDRVISPDMAPRAFAYLDDIVICTVTFAIRLLSWQLNYHLS